MGELNFDDEATREEGDELEAIVNRLVGRLMRAREGSAEYRMIIRQLVGIRDGSQMGSLVMEEFTYSGGLDLPPRQR